MRAILVVLLLLSGKASADTWECQAGSSWTHPANDLLIVDTGPGDGWGAVTKAGTTQAAKFVVVGFNRRWDFGPATDDGIYSYAFIMKPSGNAKYFDFTIDYEDKKTRPSKSFVCRRKEVVE